MGALHSHQDGVLLLSAEAHGQPVGSGAGPLIGRPGERDERPPLSEDVSGPSWRRRHSEKLQSETIEGTFCCRHAGFPLTRSDGRIQLSWRYFPVSLSGVSSIKMKLHLPSTHGHFQALSSPLRATQRAGRNSNQGRKEASVPSPLEVQCVQLLRKPG